MSTEGISAADCRTYVCGVVGEVTSKHRNDYGPARTPHARKKRGLKRRAAVWLLRHIPVAMAGVALRAAAVFWVLCHAAAAGEHACVQLSLLR